MTDSTNKRITMKKINGRFITTVRIGNNIYTSSRPAVRAPKIDIFKELGIATLY